MRCGKQVKYRVENEAFCHVSGGFNKFYICPDHIDLYRPLLNWKVFPLSDGETMGCDVEVRKP